MELQFAAWALLLLALVHGNEQCDNKYTEITVSRNGSDTVSCRTCFSLQFVLTRLQLKNCTKVAVYDNQTISSFLTIKNISGLLIEGAGENINVTCSSTSNVSNGLQFVNCSDVELMTIEWINCEIKGSIYSVAYSPFLSDISIGNDNHVCHSNSPTPHGNMIDNNSSLELNFTSFATNTSCLTFSGENCSLNVMLGEQIYVGYEGEYKEDDNPQIIEFEIVECDSELSSDSCHGDYHISSLYGIRTVGVTANLTQVPFFISGPQPNDVVLVVKWWSVTNTSVSGNLILKITHCKMGYIYNDSKQICVCYDKDPDDIDCNNSDYTVCVKSGQWYGPIDNNMYSIYPCPFGNCNYTVAGGCPNSKGSCQPFFCPLSENSDDLCLYNRGGILCSNCSTNYSFSFDAIRCVLETSCSNWHIGSFALVTILFWFLTVCVFIAIAKLDLRIGSGQLYCLVFYFSVLQYFVRGEFPSEFLYFVELFFSGFMQLDPKIFGLLEICIPNDKLNNLHYAAFHYINPLFLTVVIVLLVIISWKWPRFALFRNSSTGINMICIVMYVIFISLTQASLEVLTPIHFPGMSNETYVMLQPNIVFFDPAKHLPYAIVALLTQIVLVIPYLSLLLFSPYLIRISWLNLTRIKPILDEYQACYKDQYRFFVGYYLTCRQLIFILSLVLHETEYIYTLQVISIMLLTLHCLVQPYKKFLLNVVDGVLILDLVLLSILHGNTANIVFAEVMLLKIILVHVLVLVPVLYCICLCLNPLVQLIIKKYNCFHKTQRSTSRGTNTYEPSYGSYEALEREPLIFDSNSGKYNTCERVSSNARQDKFTSTVVGVSQ